MTKIDQQVGSAGLGRTRIPLAAYLLTACIGVIGSNSLALGPIAPEVGRDIGASVPGVMTAASAFGLGTAASALFLARHIDRIGATRMLQLAMAMLAGALAVSAAAPFLAVLVAAQLAAGLASGLAIPAIYSSAAAVAPAGRESETIGIVLTGWTLSLVAGVSLAALLADFLHWRAVYAAVALLALAALASLAIGGLRDERKMAGPALSPLAALAIPGVTPLLAACGAFMIAFYGVYGYLGDHLHQALGQPISANGLAALCYGAGFGGAAFLDGYIDRLSGKRILPFVFLAVAAVYAAIALASGHYVATLAVMVLWGLANHFGLNLLVTRLTAIDPARRGAIMGLNSAVTYLAVFIGTAGFGPLYAAFGFPLLAFAAAALSLLAALAASR